MSTITTTLTGPDGQVFTTQVQIDNPPTVIAFDGGDDDDQAEPEAAAPAYVPKAGDLVDFTLHEGQNKGQVRGAIVTKPWGANCVNLRVFADGSNDGLSNEWVTSATRNDDPEVPRSWRPRQ